MPCLPNTSNAVFHSPPHFTDIVEMVELSACRKGKAVETALNPELQTLDKLHRISDPANASSFPGVSEEVFCDHNAGSGNRPGANLSSLKLSLRQILSLHCISSSKKN